MQRWISIALIIVALGGAAWAFLPIPTKTITFESTDPAWSYRIEQAEYLRAGEVSDLVVDVIPPDVFGGGLDNTQTTVRIDFPGLFEGQNEASQVVPVGKNARFRWPLGPAEPGKYEGRVWIYNGLAKVVLNVRTVQVEVRGMDTRGQLVLRIGVFVLLIAGIYLMFTRPSARKT